MRYTRVCSAQGMIRITGRVCLQRIAGIRAVSRAGRKVTFLTGFSSRDFLEWRAVSPHEKKPSPRMNLSQEKGRIMLLAKF